MKSTVTIGICVKDCEDTLEEVIDSILNQDFPHDRMEVIFVDDGSKDRTLSIIKESISEIDTQVKVFSHEWKGLGSTRNVVVNNASGNYIIWVDGDMLLPKDHVRKQVEFMEQNPKVGIAKARYEMYTPENLIGALENIAYMAVDFKYKGKGVTRTMGTGGSIYRVKAIRDIGGFDEHIKGAGEDMDTEYRIRNAGWSLYRATPATFYEKRRKTWKDLWNEAFWHGYNVHYIFRKNARASDLCKMVPLAGFVAGVWYSLIAYKLIRQKWVFLLPIQYTFKRIAWCFGFAKGQISGNKYDETKCGGVLL